jgi:epoxyqueuosine reductase
LRVRSLGCTSKDFCEIGQYQGTISLSPSTEIKQHALDLGFLLVGISAPSPPAHFEEYRRWIEKGYHGEMQYLQRHLPLKGDPNLLLPGVSSIVMVALGYNQPNPPVEGQPRIARYALGRDYHKVMRRKLAQLSSWLDERHPGSRQRVCVDSAPICERDYANQAGLGWFGKNTMLINSARGSWFFLGGVLTTVAFVRDDPAIGGCGTCRRCIDACPTGAIVYEDDRWQVDARRCISYQTIEKKGELTVDTAGWTFGCDICQEVCPFNEPRDSQPLRAAMTEEPDFLARRRFPSLTELAQISERDWDVATRGSALRRTGHSGLVRNARANLFRAENPVIPEKFPETE